MPPPFPPRKSAGQKWAIAGATFGGLALLGMVASAVLHGGQSSGGGSGGDDGSPKYRITVPQTLAGGKYKLVKDLSQQADASVPHDGAYAHGLKTAGGQYANGTTTLVMMGIYGTIDDPATAVDHTLRGMTSDGNTAVAVSDRKITPSSGGGPLTCGVDVRRQSGQKITLSYCVWADSRTNASVAKADGADLAQDPQSIDLQALADETAKIRTEVRKPMG
ncbi:hypothetical protein ABZ851_02880 [Streptomyces sp. NPDC047049]|uniref:hypothetical protein n=1 Tax=Streptomyces sp. NPDC047049 TaxID=3156688 RepID=UPI0033F9A351